MNGIVCAYFGRPEECHECGGFNETGTPFCSHECGADQAARVARQAAAVQVRRDREAAFGAAVAELAAQGVPYEKIDVLLAGMPS